MIYFRCTACGRSHASTLQLSRELFERSDLEDREEACPLARRHVVCSRWLMYWSDEETAEVLARPWLDASQIGSEHSARLTGAEASTIMELAENGSLPMTSAAASAVDKLRKALAVSRGGPNASLQVVLTDEEAEFLARTRMA